MVLGIFSGIGIQNNSQKSGTWNFITLRVAISKFPYLKECSLLEVLVTFDRFHLKSGSRSTLGKVHVQLNKFLKIAKLQNCLFKKFLCWVVCTCTVFYGLNLITTGLIESIYIIKTPKIFVFTVETRAKMSRFSMEGNNGSFYTIGWAQEFLEVFSWRADAQIHIQELRCSTPLFSCLCHC